MANINMQGNTFNNNSNGIRNVFESSPESVDFKKFDFEKLDFANIDFTKIEEDLRAIKESLEKIGKTVEALEHNSKEHDEKGFCAAIKEFCSEFASGTLAGLAGNYLSKLFKL